MSVITLPWSMEQDRINQIKANSTHVDDNFNTLLNAVNNKLEKDGSVLPTADQSWNGHKITNLAVPTASADAATKGYVDTVVSNAAVPATTSTPGHVVIGANIDVDAAGKISIPVATTEAPGVVQIGDPMVIDQNGVLSVQDATTTQSGVVQLGKTDTIAGAETVAVRATSISNSIPNTGADGVIYFTFDA